MSKPLTVSELDALATSIRDALDRVSNGDLAASTATEYRLQGALVALDTALGVSADDLLRFLLSES